MWQKSGKQLRSNNIGKWVNSSWIVIGRGGKCENSHWIVLTRPVSRHASSCVIWLWVTAACVWLTDTRGQPMSHVGERNSHVCVSDERHEFAIKHLSHVLVEQLWRLFTTKTLLFCKACSGAFIFNWIVFTIISHASTCRGTSTWGRVWVLWKQVDELRDGGFNYPLCLCSQLRLEIQLSPFWFLLYMDKLAEFVIWVNVCYFGECVI